ncbi:MAG: DUF354 domain-containing protein [Flavobacteriales bacterium]|nr:DUF354 domain-containing protein [Flavobacteriales bacterium]
MNFLFYIGHPAHYHNFKNVAKRLIEMGHACMYLVRPKDVLLDLLSEETIETVLLPKKSGRTKVSMIKDVLHRNRMLVKLIRSRHIDLMVGTDVSIAQMGRLMKVLSVVVNEDDAEAVPLFAKLAYPFAHRILAPNGCSMGRFESKTIRYAGYHELAYLHPEHFVPDTKLLAVHGLSYKNYVVMRFSALNAHHDKGVQGIDDHFARKIIDALGEELQVVITSERKLGNELEPYRMKFQPSEIHHVLAGAKLLVGDSQTMAAEAMVLGTPSIRCNDFVGRLAYLEELENKYNLGFGVLPESKEEILGLVDKVVLSTDQQVWADRRMHMLSEKVNVANYWTELFVNLAQEK